jgi:short-subunit dehydrogenase
MAKTILITGASSGLGAGMAREFAAKGYNLALCARRLERLETLKQELQSQYSIQVGALL